MSVSGELGDFDLGGILQILAGNRASGRLHVSAEPDDVALFLEEGRLVAVASARLPLRLGRILRQQGLVSDAQVREALQIQKAEGRRRSLGEILVDRGWVTEEQVARSVENQCIVALARVMAAGSGTFSYKTGVRPPAKGPTAPIEPNAVLLEALHRMDKLVRLRAQLPSPTAPLAISAHLGNMFVPTSDDEFRVVGALRAGVDSWREMVDLLQADEVALLRALVALIDRGVVVEAAAESPPVRPLVVDETDQTRLFMADTVARAS
jgi:hypothetical protein